MNCLIALDDSVKEILNSREEAFHFKQTLALKNGIISLSFNIPGPNKRPVWGKTLMEKISKELQQEMEMRQVDIISEHQFDNAAGYFYIFVLTKTINYFDLKRITVNFENQHKIGRLLDIDVISDDLEIISRGNLGFPERLCFLCSQPITCCMMNNHSVSQLYTYFEYNAINYLNSIKV